jgi:DNA repair protein SbcD/Mre11
MKIVHFADLHIGVENYGTIDAETGLSSRLNDFLAVFDELVDYSITQSVDLVILAGDVYKARDPSQTHQREFAKRLSRLSAHSIPTFVVVGNHDLPNSTNRATAVEIFPTLHVDDVYIGDNLQTTLIKTHSSPIQIISLPWPRKGTILSRDETRGLNIDEVRLELEKRLTRGIEIQANKLDSSIPAILVGHVTVNGATVGSERSMMMGNDHILNVSSLQFPAIDYVALGHIHKHQIVRQGPPMVVYAGSLERVDFSEEHDEKGFCVIELDPNQTSGTRVTKFEFKPVKARRFLTIDVEVEPNTLDPTNHIVNSITKLSIDGAIVRLRVKIPSTLYGLIDDRIIRNSMSDAQYIANITYDVVSERRPSLQLSPSDGITPEKALNSYIKNKDSIKDFETEFLEAALDVIKTVNDQTL